MFSLNVLVSHAAVADIFTTGVIGSSNFVLGESLNGTKTITFKNYVNLSYFTATAYVAGVVFIDAWDKNGVKIGNSLSPYIPTSSGTSGTISAPNAKKITITGSSVCLASLNIYGEEALNPRVVSIDPIDNAVDVALNKSIKITFNNPIKSDSVDNVGITGVDCNKVWLDSKTLKLTPKVLLNVDTTYNVFVKNIIDTNNLGMESDFFSSFKTIYPSLSNFTGNISNVTYDSFNVSWDNVVNATSYDIYLNDNKITTVTNNSYSFLNCGLVYNSNYKISIEAKALNYKSKRIDLNCKTLSMLPPLIVLSSTVKKISVSWLTVVGAKEMRLYLNNSFQPIILPVTTLFYTFDNLACNTNYNVRVEAYINSVSSTSMSADILTKNYFSAKPVGDVDVDMTTAKIKWSDILDTDYYEVKLSDSGVVSVVHDLFYDFQSLEMETSYSAFVRQVNIAGVRSDWTKIDFVTLGPPEVPPDAPSKIKVIEIDTNFIIVEVVDDDLWVDGFNFYKDNVKIVSQVGKIFKFTGLTASTTYSLSVKAYNKYGEGRFAVNTIAQSGDIKYPTVTSSSSTFTKPSSGSGGSGGSGSGGSGGSSGSDPSKQTVSWVGIDVKSGYKILVDGQEVGTYPADASSADLDLVALGFSPGSHDIEIVPLDADGKGYKFKLNSQTTNNRDLDKVVGDINDGSNVLKKAGLYVVFGLILLIVLLFVISFIWYKMKLGLSTSTPEQLEADPDGVVGFELSTKKDGRKNRAMDMQLYKNAKDAESQYYFDSKTEKRFLNFLGSKKIVDKKLVDNNYFDVKVVKKAENDAQVVNYNIYVNKKSNNWSNRKKGNYGRKRKSFW